MHSEARPTTEVERKLRTPIEHATTCGDVSLATELDGLYSKPVPKGPPPIPPPPPKNLLNSSSGDISSSNIGPRPGDLAKPLNGDCADAEPGANLLSGSPPNLSNLDFLSGSDRIWKALETTTCAHQTVSPCYQSTRLDQVYSSSVDWR